MGGGCSVRLRRGRISAFYGKLFLKKATPTGAIILLPGGGYGTKMTSYEGRDVCTRLNKSGFNSFMLEYRVAPNGILDEDVVGKLCFGLDGTHFELDDINDPFLKQATDFHLCLMDRLKVPEELRRKVYRENILELTASGKP